MDRVGPKSYALTTVLDVPGKSPGTICAGLQYGVTALMDREAAEQYPEDLKNVLSGAVNLYERGVGDDVKLPQVVSAIEPKEGSPIESESQRVLQWIAEFGFPYEKDIRGRLVSQDIRDYLEILKSNGAGAAPMTKAEAARRSQDLLDYWGLAQSVTHNRDLWGPFLVRNHLPADTPHDRSVTAAEARLTAVLARPLGPEWAKSAAELIDAYSSERGHMAKTMGAVPPIEYHARVSPCPQAATRSSGGSIAGIGEVRSSLTEFYPPDMRRYQVQGLVVLALRIAATGCVTEAGVGVSSGSEAMDNSAMRWVETASFLPAERDGRMVASEKQLAVNFHIVE
jgi:TonB family protein